jgi:hypothetical protein
MEWSFEDGKGVGIREVKNFITLYQFFVAYQSKL